MAYIDYLNFPLVLSTEQYYFTETPYDKLICSNNNPDIGIMIYYISIHLWHAGKKPPYDFPVWRLIK